MSDSEDAPMIDVDPIPSAAKGKAKAVNPVNPEDDTLPWYARVSSISSVRLCS